MGSGASIHHLPASGGVEPTPKPKPAPPAISPVPSSVPATADGVTTDFGTNGGDNIRHWRIDLKWLFGIPFTVILALTVAVLAMFMATASDNAQQTIAAANEPILAEQQFMGDTTTVAPGMTNFLQSPDFAQTVYENPSALDAEIDAIPNGPVLPPSPDDGTIANGSVSPDGSTFGTGPMGQSEGPAQGTKTMLKFYTIPLKFFSGGVHQALGGILAVLTVLLAALGIPYIIFSRRFGKMISPGISLAIASWGPFLLLVFTRGAFNNWLPDSGGLVAGQEQLLRQVMKPLASGILDPVYSVYLAAVILSVVLLAAAGIARLATRIRASRA